MCPTARRVAWYNQVIFSKMDDMYMASFAFFFKKRKEKLMLQRYAGLLKHNKMYTTYLIGKSNHSVQLIGDPPSQVSVTHVFWLNLMY